MAQKGKPKGGPRPGAGMPKGFKTAKVQARESGQVEALLEIKETAKLSAQRVLDELALHSFANVQDLFDESGNLRPIHTLTRAQAASIASFEVIKKNMTAGHSPRSPSWSTEGSHEERHSHRARARAPAHH